MTIVCFGDSNTFGYDPRSPLGERYPAEARWVDILAQKTGWDIRNNGRNGREIPRRETIFSKSTDLLIVMLGTNDLLQGNSVAEVSARMERFLTTLPFARNHILLLAPPPLQRGAWVQEQALLDASVALADSYRTLAEQVGVRFLDSGAWDISLAFDGVHFTEDGNRVFAEKLYHYLENL